MQEEKLLMTEGTIWKLLVRFAFPLFLGGLFQQLYNTVDSWVVARYCGDNALAAVSSSGSLIFLMVGFFQGVFLGGGVLISNRYGAGDKEGVDKAVHTMVVFSVVIGILLSIFGVLMTPVILRWMGTPAKVMVESVLYFRIYCSGMLALVLYNMANGIFQSLGDSRHPLWYLIIASIANFILDFLFVAGFHWGVAGAALATVLGQLLSALLAFFHLMSGRFVVRIRLRALRADPSILWQVFRLGLPGGVQNSMIAAANVVVQSAINSFGDQAVAGCGIYIKVEGFVFLPIMALTMAMTTFIGQNLGADRPDRAHACARQGTAITVILAELTGVVIVLLAPSLISLFSETPAVIAYGVRQAHVEALFFCLLAFSQACAATLRGAGRTFTPMVIMLSVWCLLRIVYIAVVLHFSHSILGVFLAYPVTWAVSSLLFIIELKRRDWALDVHL